MERLYNQDDRIRRAEEIYARRQSLREKTKKATLNVSSEQNNFGLLKKIALQFVICILIYAIFYLIDTTNYSFSEMTLSKTEKWLSNDLDFYAIYVNIQHSIGDFFSKINMGDEKKDEINNENKEEGNEEQGSEEQESDKQGNEDNNEKEENLGSNEEDESLTQSEINVAEESEIDKIKNKYSFALPVSRHYFIRIWHKRSYI